MEEVIVVFFQFFLEVVLQIFGGLGFDWGTSRTRNKDEEKENASCGWLFAFGVVGGICGGLSLLFAPNAILPNAGLRIANLFVALLLAGGLSYFVFHHWRQHDGKPADHFWRGFVFAFVFGLVRFAYISR